MTYITSFEIESRGIERVRFIKVRYTHPKMAEFVHRCRA